MIAYAGAEAFSPFSPPLPPVRLAMNSWYRNTSPLPRPLPPLPNALRPLKPSTTMSISRSVNLRSPGSGAVCSRASFSSARSIWPSSPSSKASNAALSSLERDKPLSRSDSVFKKVARLIDCAPLKYDASVDGVAESPSCDSMSATSAELTCPSLSRSMTLKHSRMLCRSGGGTLDSASLVTVRVKGAGRVANGAGLSTGFS
jgi:hypothetical protein